MTPQHHSDTQHCNPTQKGNYPVILLPSSRNGGPEGFVPIPSSCELPWVDTPTEWVFSCLCVFYVFCGIKCFLVVDVQSYHQPPWKRSPNCKRTSADAVGHQIWIVIGSQGAPPCFDLFCMKSRIQKGVCKLALRLWLILRKVNSSVVNETFMQQKHKLWLVLFILW